MGSITQDDTTTTAASTHDSLQIPRDPVQTKLVIFAAPADGSRPYDHNGRVPEGQVQQNYGSDIQEVAVNNIRGYEQEFDLNRHGFAGWGMSTPKSRASTSKIKSRRSTILKCSSC
jgi:hypothetical protein